MVFITICTDTINLAHVKRFRRMGNHIIVWFADSTDLTHYRLTSQVAAEQMEAKILDELKERHLILIKSPAI